MTLLVVPFNEWYSFLSYFIDTYISVMKIMFIDRQLIPSPFLPFSNIHEGWYYNVTPPISNPLSLSLSPLSLSLSLYFSLPYKQPSSPSKLCIIINLVIEDQSLEREGRKKKRIIMIWKKKLVMRRGRVI